MKRYPFYILAFVIICAPFWNMKGLGYQVYLNLTNSMNGYVFIGKRLSTDDVLVNGNCIAFFHDLYRAPIIKRIVATPGDAIKAQENGIRIMEKIYPKYEDAKKELTLSAFLPKGKYFVVGDHPKSFDSRYARFGLIDRKAITHKVWKVI